MTTPRIAVTQTGSLPRSRELTALLTQERDSGASRSDTVREQAAAAVREVVRQQIEVGIDVVGDGEQGKVGFQIYFPQRFAGFGGESERQLPSDWAKHPQWQASFEARLEGIVTLADPPAAIGDIVYEGAQEAVEDCDVLTDTIAEAGREPSTGFLTAPSPGIVATTFRNKHYDSYEAYLAALGTELRKEYQVIIDAGLILQVDAPDLAMERVMYFQDQSVKEFCDAVELHIDALNTAIAGFPREQVRLHCCWGNQASPHTDDIPLKEILPLITKAKVGALGVAFGNPRHAHEIAVVAEMGFPEDMILIAGVVDTTTNYVEHPEVVSMRLKEAVRAVGDVSRVIASPDCGFSTFAGFDWVADDIVWEKFRVLREGADLAAAAFA
jgi:5-methyltetrahydropteroyltriglutamate--homocysteine methyltransferase